MGIACRRNASCQWLDSFRISRPIKRKEKKRKEKSVDRPSRPQRCRPGSRINSFKRRVNNNTRPSTNFFRPFDTDPLLSRTKNCNICLYKRHRPAWFHPRTNRIELLIIKKNLEFAMSSSPKSSRVRSAGQMYSLTSCPVETLLLVLCTDPFWWRHVSRIVV